MTSIIDRVEAIGLPIPGPPPPSALVSASVRAGSLLFLSGQVAAVDGKLLAAGAVGTDLDIDTAKACARQCAVNLLTRLSEAVGVNQTARALKVTVFVASAADFTEQSQVANAASDVIVEVLGTTGPHARAAIGVASLPLGSPVEVEGIFEIVTADQV